MFTRTYIPCCFTDQQKQQIMETKQGKKAYKIQFIVYAILGVITFIPLLSASKANLMGYHSICTFTPVSSLICFSLTALYFFKYKKSIYPSKHLIAVKLLRSTLIITAIVMVGGLVIFSIASEHAEEYYITSKSELISSNSGVYIGEHKFANLLTFAKVQIKVVDGKIKDIDFIKLVNTPTHECKDEVMQRIVDSQEINFDAVSGATCTSNFAKAAVANALVGDK